MIIRYRQLGGEATIVCRHVVFSGGNTILACRASDNKFHLIEYSDIIGIVAVQGEFLA